MSCRPKRNVRYHPKTGLLFISVYFAGEAGGPLCMQDVTWMKGAAITNISHLRGLKRYGTWTRNGHRPLLPSSVLRNSLTLPFLVTAACKTCTLACEAFAGARRTQSDRNTRSSSVGQMNSFHLALRHQEWHGSNGSRFSITALSPALRPCLTALVNTTGLQRGKRESGHGGFARTTTQSPGPGKAL